MSCSKITFPQPIGVVLERGTEYFCVNYNNKVVMYHWYEDSADKDLISVGNCYATRAAARQRADWNKQEIDRVRIPAWFLALGPDVEILDDDGKWSYLDQRLLAVENWSKVDPKNFRTAPKPSPDVVKVINGVEYRWPATATRNEPRGLRYVVDDYGDGEFSEHNNSLRYGPHVHLTRQAAETQAAALKAFWK